MACWRHSPVSNRCATTPLFRDFVIGRALLVGTALLGTGVFLADRWATGLTATQWFLPLSFFGLMVLHDGVRLGRKTYLVDLGGADKRTDYVAVSNTLIGIVLLVMGAVASMLQAYGNAVAILVLSLLALVAGVFIARLPEVQSR